MLTPPPKAGAVHPVTFTSSSTRVASSTSRHPPTSAGKPVPETGRLPLEIVMPVRVSEMPDASVARIRKSGTALRVIVLPFAVVADAAIALVVIMSMGGAGVAP